MTAFTVDLAYTVHHYAVSDDNADILVQKRDGRTHRIAPRGVEIIVPPGGDSAWGLVKGPLVRQSDGQHSNRWGSVTFDTDPTAAPERRLDRMPEWLRQLVEPFGPEPRGGGR